MPIRAPIRAGQARCAAGDEARPGARRPSARDLPGPTPKLFEIAGQAFAKHIGAEAAGFIGATFSLHDRAEIHDLIGSAGFHEVAVQPATKSPHLPPPEEFLWQYVSTTPLAALAAQADDERLAALERDVVSGWQELVQDGELVVELRYVVTTARR